MKRKLHILAILFLLGTFPVFAESASPAGREASGLSSSNRAPAFLLSSSTSSEVVVSAVETPREPMATNAADMAKLNSSWQTVKGGGEKAVPFPSGDLPKFSPWKSIGWIVFILGALIAVQSYVRRRFGGLARSRAKHIKLVERFALDSKRSVYLLDVEGRRILIGMGGDRIVSLGDLGEVKEEAFPEEDDDE